MAREKPWRIHVPDTLAATADMSAAEVGALMLLNMHGRQLPTDDIRLARITRATPDEWSAIRPKIARFFTDDWRPKPICTDVRKLRVRESRRVRWQQAPLRKAVRLAVFERDGFACVYCGDRPSTLHVDHIHPVVLGGTSALGNLATACKPCNSSKGARPLDQWRGRRGTH